MKYSILVPVYNVEQYIVQCIESVLTQKISCYELILADDGSTDKSGEICREYARRYDNIFYYKKNNEGLLLTRRFLLKKAVGDYVIFLDSDDFWSEDFLTVLDSKINNHDIDVFFFRFNTVSNNGLFIESFKDVFPEDTLFEGKEIDKALTIFFNSSKLNSLCLKCIKRDIIDIDADYTSFKDRKSEDYLQSIYIMLNAQKMYYINECIYNYRLSDSGRSRRYKLKYVDDFLVVQEYASAMLKKYGSSEYLIYCQKEGFLRDVVETIIPSVIYNYRLKDFQNVASRIRKSSLFSESFEARRELKLSSKEMLLIWIIKRHLESIIYLIFKLRYKNNH
ncbi:MAG: glycosyltransferase family 2 protein [Bacteroides sp.]|nr:glycosyltransferase family 2 protein [Bacteroides sp.]